MGINLLVLLQADSCASVPSVEYHITIVPIVNCDQKDDSQGKGESSKNGYNLDVTVKQASFIYNKKLSL